MGYTRVAIRGFIGALLVFGLIAAVGCSRPTATPATSDEHMPDTVETGSGQVEEYPAPQVGEEATPPPEAGKEGYPPPPTPTPTLPADYPGPADTPTAEATE